MGLGVSLVNELSAQAWNEHLVKLPLDPPASVTFGIGHIVNLFAGQANLETVIQVLFAIAWGFIFTMVYLKSGSLLPCIIAHGLVDAFSKFSDESITMAWVYMIATIIIAVVYCIYLSKLPNKAIETKYHQEFSGAKP